MIFLVIRTNYYRYKSLEPKELYSLEMRTSSAWHQICILYAKLKNGTWHGQRLTSTPAVMCTLQGASAGSNIRPTIIDGPA